MDALVHTEQADPNAEVSLVFCDDAFIHTLMGIIYQSTKDYNNAFIAYRNALDVYENEYAKMFHMSVPEQLQKDLVNTA